MRIHTAAAVFAVCASTFAANAETFNFEPDMPITLGRTWNPLEPFTRANLGTCFTPTIPTDTPVARIEFSEDFVDTLIELQRKSSFSLSASGSTSFGLSRVKANAEYAELRELFSSNTSVVYAVTGTRTYDAMQLDGAEFNERGRQKQIEARAKSDPSIFYDACGEAIVTSITRQSRIGLIYIFKTSSSAAKDSIRRAISAAASTPASDLEASVNILDEVRKIDNSTTLEVRVYQDGVRDNVSSLDAVIGNNPGDLDAVRATLKTAIDAMEWRNSQVISFTADQVSNYFDVEDIPDWRYISTLYGKLDLFKNYSDRLVDRYVQLDLLQRDAENNLVTFREGKDLELLQEKSEALDAIEKLVAEAKQCFLDAREICRVAEPRIDTSLLKFVNVDFGQFLTWDAKVAGNHYNDHSELIEATVTYWPRFTLRNRRLIREFQLLRNGRVELILTGNGLDGSINDEVLSTELKWSRAFTRSDYCWRGRWGEECNPWAADIRRHKNDLRARDNDSSYEFVIIDIEGNELKRAMPKISEIDF